MIDKNNHDGIASDSAKNLWQNQPLEDTTMTIEEVRSRIARLARTVRRRNLIGGFACISVMLLFSYFAFGRANVIFRVGSVLTVLGAGFIGLQLIRGKLLPRGVPAPETQGQAGLTFYRKELERQRDFHQGRWLWSRLLIFVPGPALVLIGQAQADPSYVRVVAIEALVFAFLLIYSIPRNLRMARNFQRELDALNN